MLAEQLYKGVQTPRTKRHSGHSGRRARSSKHSSLAGVRNLHCLRIPALALVKHFEDVLVWDELAGQNITNGSNG